VLHHGNNPSTSVGRFEEIAVDRRSIGAAARRPFASRSETRDQWIELGARDGGFGALIPVGIRIDLDALDRLRESA